MHRTKERKPKGTTAKSFLISHNVPVPRKIQTVYDFKGAMTYVDEQYF